MMTIKERALVITQLLFWLLLRIAPSAGVRYVSYCAISKQDEVSLRYNAAVGEYQEDTDSSLRRVLGGVSETTASMTSFSMETDLVSFSVEMFDLSTIQTAVSVNVMRRAQDSLPETIRVRPCPCADKFSYPSEKFYCPANKEYCAIPSRYERGIGVEPACLNLRNNDLFVRSVWPIVVVWFGLGLIFFFCTVPGRNALDCFIASAFPCWNRLVVNSIIRRNPNRANIMIQRYWNRRRQQLEQRYRDMLQNSDESGVEMQQQRRPTELTLKTKIYKVEESGLPSVATLVDDEEFLDDQGHSCSICFVPIENGDRVGALPCNHMFHVDCLKGWLKRRNVCPLCMQTDVATPRETPLHSATHDEDDS